MKNVLLDHPLSPDGTRPVMCIDEAQVMILDICGEVCMMQVLDPTLGWGTFRQDYGSATWAWLSAATGARLHRSMHRSMLHFCTGDIVRGTLKCSKLE